MSDSAKKLCISREDLDEFLTVYIDPYFQLRSDPSLERLNARLCAWFVDQNWEVCGLDSKRSGTSHFMDYKERRIYISLNLPHRSCFVLLRAWFTLQWSTGRFCQDIEDIKYRELEMVFPILAMKCFLDVAPFRILHLGFAVERALELELFDLGCAGFDFPIYSEQEKKQAASLCVRSVIALMDALSLPVCVDAVGKIVQSLKDTYQSLCSHNLCQKELCTQREYLGSVLREAISRQVPIEESLTDKGIAGIYIPSKNVIRMPEGQKPDAMILLHEYIHFLQNQRSGRLSIAPSHTLESLKKETEAILVSGLVLHKLFPFYSLYSATGGYLYDLFVDYDSLHEQRLEMDELKDFVTEHFDSTIRQVLDMMSVSVS